MSVAADSARGTPMSAVAGRAAVVASALALAAAAVVLAAAVAVWPAATIIAVVVACIALLAWRAPAAALLAALLLFDFEGTVKIALTNGGVPLSASGKAAGAAALDAGFLAALAGILLRDRGETLRAVWRAAGRWERIALGVLTAWWLLSIPQIAQSGDLHAGLDGFRLTQFYALATLAALVVYRGDPPRRRVTGLLAVGLVAGAYATLRVIIGPAVAERSYALAQDTVSAYGRAFRAVGSFSGAVPLVSLLAPVAVVAIALALYGRGQRLLAAATGAFAVVGVVGSYGRAPLVAVVAGLAVATAVGVSGRVSRRRRSIAIGVTALVLIAGGAGTVIAATKSPVLRDRVHGLLHPRSDSSFRMRWDTWKDTVREIRHEPQGAGLGTVGRATQSAGKAPVTTDNSYLKVFREQGILGGLLFVLGTVATCVAAALRLRRRPAAERALGLAALSGFVAFLGLLIAGEYIEQPGKAFAWALLGIAIAQAFPTRRGGADEPLPGPRAALLAGTSPLRGQVRGPRDARAHARARLHRHGLRARLAFGTWRTGVAWALLVALLVAAPIAVARERRGTYVTSAQVFPVAVGGLPAPQGPGYYLGLLADPAVHQRSVEQSGLSAMAHPLKAVRITAVPGFDRVRLSVAAATPVRAQALLEAYSHQLSEASARDARTAAGTAAAAARADLAKSHSPHRRAALRRRLRTLDAVTRAPSPRLVVAPRPPPPRVTGGVDRRIDALPGDLPQRSRLLWAAVAGLAVAALVWAAWPLLALGWPARRDRPRADA